jgi:hypothetical protein
MEIETNAFPDTLVLKVQEFESKNNLDTVLYILYDYQKQCFIVRGKRNKQGDCTYSFECESSVELVDFVTFLIDKENSISYILYNYDNLPMTSNEITFEFLAKYDHIDYEISGYDNLRLKRKELLRNIRMLRNVFNRF